MFKPHVILIVLTLAASQALAGSAWENYAQPKHYKAARISSYDKTGGNADGMQQNPIKAGETRVLAEVSGPAQIAHIWVTMAGEQGHNPLRDIVIRMYWDGETKPSVEAPIGEFFGLGHGRYYTFESQPLVIGNNRGLNCFFPMPFKKSAKITVENAGTAPLRAFYYYVDYQIFLGPQPEFLYFHAQYRQEKPTLSKENYTILDAVGRGHYAGCFLFVHQNQPGWFGEGDDMIYVDGEKTPSLYGTGTEDYFCQAWGLAKGQSTLRFGSPVMDGRAVGSEQSLYRFHVEDPVTFGRSIKVTIEHGHGNDRSDDFASVAYWYQTEPHQAFPALPPPAAMASFTDRLQSMLDEKRAQDYRTILADAQQRTQSSWLKQDCAMKIADSYAEEGLKDKAIETLKASLGPLADYEWSGKVANRIMELGGDAGNLPVSGEATAKECSDGQVIAATIGDKTCARTDKAARSLYIYFDVNPAVLRRGDRTVLVEVDYYDEGTPSDKFWIEYDSAFSENPMDRYHESTILVKTGEKGWHTAKFTLERARFAGWQNCAADFRISCGGDGDEYISAVRVALKK